MARFKAKWFKRTPKNRVEFYRDKLQQYYDRLVALERAIGEPMKRKALAERGGR